MLSATTLTKAPAAEVIGLGQASSLVQEKVNRGGTGHFAPAFFAIGID